MTPRNPAAKGVDPVNTPTERLAVALADAETFTREQVAWLLHKALTAADLTDPLLPGLAESLPTDLAYQAGHADGYAAGEDAAFAEMHADLRYALGGPDAKTMNQAVQSAQRHIERKAHAAFLAEQSPHPLCLDDPDWPSVSVPGTIADPHALPSYWTCPCPRTTDGQHVTPPVARVRPRHLQAVA